MKTTLRQPFILLVVAIGAVLGFCSCAKLHQPSPATALGVRIVQTNEQLRVELNGRFFTEYHYRDVPRPFCYPIINASGLAMTRNFPMRRVAGEETDHPHHRSLWFAHAPVNGEDLWTEKPGAGRILHRGFVEIASGVNTGLIKTRNDWVSAAGKILCTDEQTLRFYPCNDNATIVLDFEIKLMATHGDVVFGDSKEGSFAVRVAESMRVLQPSRKGDPARAGQGQILLSTGVRDDGTSAAQAKDAKREAVTWGKRAAWCDYSGPVDGKMVGFTIMDHPSNPRHPTWWHVRDYGLFAANPFGQHEFEGLKDKTAGDFKIASGQSATFKYRVVIHDGDDVAARIAERFDEFIKN